LFHGAIGAAKGVVSECVEQFLKKFRDRAVGEPCVSVDHVGEVFPINGHDDLLKDFSFD
jgi:hypothetical protein